ncbi:MAG: signal peptidase II [Pirellulales bacterium]|nr:signal peptidase II [Pirellulales bacterium]
MDERTSTPWSRHLLFWSLAAAGLALDLGTKHWMFAQKSLRAGDVLWIWPGHVGLQLSLNEGALFGMGQGKAWLFAACSIAAAIAIPTWLFAFGGARDRGLTIVLGCILGGVLGNLYDRAGLPGLDWGVMNAARQGEPVYAVRDFVLLAWRWSPQWQERIVWPNFNVADSLLVCGAGVLMLLSFRHGREGEGDAESLQRASTGAA